MTKPSRRQAISTEGLSNLTSGQTTAEWASSVFKPPIGASVIRIADVAPEGIDWLWERWIPAGMLTLLGGATGEGKSTVIASLVGILTTGSTFPDGTTAPRTNILLLSAEDDLASTIRPRLDLQGADPERVYILRATIRGDGLTRWFDLKRDVEVMRGVIEENDIGLVVIEPLSGYLPLSDRQTEGEIRAALHPLVSLVEETGIGVVGIIHAGTAGSGREATHRLPGIAALARSVLMVADLPVDRQPDDIATNGKLKVLQVVKSNVSISPAPRGFRRPLDRPVEWLGPSEIGIEECVAQPTARERGRIATERNDAVEFLRETLADGALPTAEVLSQARAQGFSERTLRRAKNLLAIRAIRTDTKIWMWSMPTNTTPNDRPAGTSKSSRTNVGSLAKE